MNIIVAELNACRGIICDTVRDSEGEIQQAITQSMDETCRTITTSTDEIQRTITQSAAKTTGLLFYMYIKITS